MCSRHSRAVVECFDAAGNPWCRACQHRADLMNAGWERQFPEQHGKTFSIGAGADGWRGFAIGATDALVQKIVAHLGDATAAPARAA